MAKKIKKTFLVCMNDKEHSKTALRFACAKAKVTNSNVEMLCVIDPVISNTFFSVADTIKEERIVEAQKFLSEMEEQAYEWSGIKPKSSVREGGIVDEITTRIEEDQSICLLFVGVAADGSSAKGGLLGQMVTEIGDKYYIPLMVIPGNLTDKQIEELNRYS